MGDPREEDPEVVKALQVIEIRDSFLRRSTTYFDQVASGRFETPEHEFDCHFRTPPVHHSQLYQFIDVDDDSVQEIICAAETSPTCSKLTWGLHKGTLKKIRNRMTVKLQQMRAFSSDQPALLDAGHVPALTAGTEEANGSAPAVKADTEATDGIDRACKRKRFQVKRNADNDPAVTAGTLGADGIGRAGTQEPFRIKRDAGSDPAVIAGTEVADGIDRVRKLKRLKRVVSEE